jgi:uncharacterized membrane protein YcaP (DUF421 family)
MDFLWRTDWGRLFTPEMSLLEILVRGTLTYLALCLLLRVVLKRQAGKVSLSDLLVVSIVAGVCRNPLVRDAYSVTDGVLVVLTVLGWSFALDWLSYYVPLIHRLSHPSPVALIRDGQVLKENLEHELITGSRLNCELRKAGVRGLAEVAEAWMEGDGHVSVIKKQELRPEQLQHMPQEQAAGDGKSGGNGPTSHERNGVPAQSRPSAEPEVRMFLEAADKLQDRVETHRLAIAEHQRGIAEIQEALARFGFRIKPTSHARPSKSTQDLPGNVAAPER